MFGQEASDISYSPKMIKISLVKFKMVKVRVTAGVLTCLQEHIDTLQFYYIQILMADVF